MMLGRIDTEVRIENSPQMSVRKGRDTTLQIDSIYIRLLEFYKGPTLIFKEEACT